MYIIRKCFLCPEEEKYLKKIILVLYYNNHPNIESIYEIYENQYNYYIITEYYLFLKYCFKSD